MKSEESEKTYDPRDYIFIEGCGYVPRSHLLAPTAKEKTWFKRLWRWAQGPRRKILLGANPINADTRAN